MEYLGHILSHEGVKVDPNKIKSIKEWKVPTTIKQLRGFLGLTGYYREAKINTLESIFHHPGYEDFYYS